jgi:hypothetical protein
MPTLLAIVFIVIVFTIIDRVPGTTWIGIGVVAAILAIGAAAWYVLWKTLNAVIMFIVLKSKKW